MARKRDLAAKIRSLRAFYAAERRAPGYLEMLRIFNYRSKHPVHVLLGVLEEQGYIRRKHGKIALGGRITGSIRLLGSVQAGFPSPAEEELLDTLSLDEFLVERPDATFMLHVSGDSMIEAGILPGDIVLVERGKEPKTNDIVVAQVDGEWTLKYFVKRGREIRLDPANRKYTPIRPKNSLEIAGVVRTVIRKYG